MAQRVQSKAKSNKKRRQNQKRRKHASKAKKQLAFDSADIAKEEGKMAAVIRLFSPRSGGSGTAVGGMASLFSPNAAKKKAKAAAQKKAEEENEEEEADDVWIPIIAEAPSADTADETVGTAEDASEGGEEVAVVEPVNNHVMAAVEAEAEVVEEEEEVEEEPVNLLGKGSNSPLDECNLQQCIIL